MNVNIELISDVSETMSVCDMSAPSGINSRECGTQKGRKKKKCMFIVNNVEFLFCICFHIRHELIIYLHILQSGDML